jgi:hypothetical protein
MYLNPDKSEKKPEKREKRHVTQIHEISTEDGHNGPKEARQSEPPDKNDERQMDTSEDEDITRENLKKKRKKNY